MEDEHLLFDLSRVRSGGAAAQVPLQLSTLHKLSCSKSLDSDVWSTIPDASHQLMIYVVGMAQSGTAEPPDPY
jgi:hypothetical protein